MKKTVSSPDVSSASGSTPKSSEEKLMVAVRVRPMQSNESHRIVHVIDKKTLVLEDETDKKDVLRQKRATDKHYFYDHVFGENSSQAEVYEATAAPLVSGALKGYAGAVFAYGATGAGKTHTMVGTPQDPGLMARALHHLFTAMADNGGEENFTVKMSYLEIYNENIRDLLNPSSGFLELREEGPAFRGRGLEVSGLTETTAKSAAEVMALLQRGERARTAEPTLANKASSRGHALLSVTVHRQLPEVAGNPGSNGGIQRGRIFLVDLAGSERAAAHRPSAGRRPRREGAHINRSLLALGNCINALSGGARYVNYRDSKLTRLLREALAGRWRSVMVAHVSPAAAHREHTRTTLHYALRANTITNRVEREVYETPFQVTQYRTVINELRNEVQRLKTKMSEERPRSGAAAKQLELKESELSEEIQQKSAEELRSLRHAIVGTFKEQMRLRRQLMELDSHLLGLAVDAERQHAIISHWEARYNRLYKPPSQGRLSTQASYRRGLEGSAFGTANNGVERSEADVAAEQAWSELAAIEREQERARSERDNVERQLESVRLRGAALEEELPSRMSSSSERELLSLWCRVHELEADKLSLQGERAARRLDLRRRDAALQRQRRQQALADDIISRQRLIIDECGMKLPSDLEDLYHMYQQEIHAATYADNADILASYGVPPQTSSSELFDSAISDGPVWSSGSSGSGRGSSSGDSEWARAEQVELAEIASGVRLPPVPTPRSTKHKQSNGIARRTNSDDSIHATATSPGISRLSLLNTNHLQQHNQKQPILDM